MKQWDYYTLIVPKKSGFSTDLDLSGFTGTLEQLGRDGWELTSSFTVDTSAHGTTNHAILIFKRPIES